jgi:hypothetical protein
MKKLIAALTLLLAFSINANAQDKNTISAADKGKKEAAELSEYLGLDKTMNENFARLFEQKNSILEDKNLSQERKTELARVIEAKIRGTLDAKQIDKLEKNPALLKKLIN